VLYFSLGSNSKPNLENWANFLSRLAKIRRLRKAKANDPELFELMWKPRPASAILTYEATEKWNGEKNEVGVLSEA